MRYPGPHRHEKLVRRLFFVAALFIFVVGLLAVTAKVNLTTPPQAQNVSISLQPQPTPTFDAVTLLKLMDERTSQPLAGQSVAVMATGGCVPGAACPLSSPLVFTATTDGQVAIPQPILRQRPKLYVTGFVMDSYFSFLNEESPNELTLYKSVDGAKLVYDVTREVVPVWLAPAP